MAAPANDPDRGSAVRAGARPRHRTVDRIAAILDLAARHAEGLTLTEFAREVDAPVSSVQGFLNGLVATGYLDEVDRRYTLGPAPYLLNLLAGRRVGPMIPHEVLERLNRESGLTSMLSVAVGQNLFYVDHVSDDPRYAWLAENHVRRSLIQTSAGWVLLADLDSRDLWALLKGLTGDDAALIDAFLAALPAIRETGTCVSPQVSAVADGASVAVRQGGRTVAAVSVIGSVEDITSRQEELTALLREVGETVST